MIGQIGVQIAWYKLAIGNSPIWKTRTRNSSHCKFISRNSVSFSQNWYTLVIVSYNSCSPILKKKSQLTILIFPYNSSVYLSQLWLNNSQLHFIKLKLRDKLTFLGEKSELRDNVLILTCNCEFISHSSDFLNQTCDFTSNYLKKKVRIWRYKLKKKSDLWEFVITFYIVFIQ